MHSTSEDYGNNNIKDKHTGAAIMGLAPWNIDTSKYSISQINLGNNFISYLEVVSLLNVFNIAHYFLHYYYKNCTNKYNIKIFIGSLNCLSYEWQVDGQGSLTTNLTFWPESL